jgi:hypothetical protein
MRRASRVCLLVRGAHQLGELHGSPFISLVWRTSAYSSSCAGRVTARLCGPHGRSWRPRCPRHS